MSDFKVGDLVECIDDYQKTNGLTAGKNYRILEIEPPFLVVNGDFGVREKVYIERFRLVETKLKVGDKVRRKNAVGIWEFVQRTEIVSFVKSESGVLYAVEHSSLEKVEEKTAPPKFTKVYVWIGKKKPVHPKVVYSNGFIDENGRLSVFEYSSADGDILFLNSCLNWEVIG